MTGIMTGFFCADNPIKKTKFAIFDNLIIILYMMLGSVKRFAQAENDDHAKDMDGLFAYW